MRAHLCVSRLPGTPGLSVVLGATRFLCVCSKFPLAETNWLKFYPQKEATNPMRTNLTPCVNNSHPCLPFSMVKWPARDVQALCSVTGSRAISSFPCLLTVPPPTCGRVNFSADKITEHGGVLLVCLLQTPLRLTDASPSHAALSPQPYLSQVLFLFQFV